MAGVAASLYAAATLTGCSDAPPSEGVGQHEQEIIGGIDARSASLNAIGTIGVKAPDYWGDGGAGVYAPLCTATLIGPRTVLTAKHCTRSGPYGAPYAEQTEMYFAVGPDARAPQRLVKVVDIEAAPLATGGYVGYGSDVAVVYLAEAITNIAPLMLGTLDESDIGQRYLGVGYGEQDIYRRSGTRKAGSMTVRALEGQTFKLMFGSFEKYAENYGYSVEDAGDGGYDPLSYIRYQYDTTFLLNGYEAYVGNARGDAQACFGDSGGPLIKRVGNQMIVTAVTSGGISSRRMQCDHGAIYATFGATTLPFLQRSLTWTDPCEGISTQGVCDGTVAKRCTGAGEGTRRISTTDCDTLFQACGHDTAGNVACVDPEAPAPEAPAVPAAPTIDELRNNVLRAYTARVEAAQE